MLTAGQYLINDELPPDLQDHNRVLDKKGVSALLRQVGEKHPESYAKVSKALADIGWRAGQETGGFSFGLQHLARGASSRKLRTGLEAKIQTLLNDDSLTDKDREKKIELEVGSHIKEQQDGVYADALKAKNPLAYQVLSGARGSKVNLTSLVGSDMLYNDARNRTIPIPILRSYSEGLRPWEVWAGAYGARKGVVDVKEATADAGYLSKQLNQTTHRLVVQDLDGPEPEADSPRGLPVDTTDSDNEGALLSQAAGPYKRNTILSPKILDHLAQLGHKRILVRSPMVGGPKEGGVWSRDVGVREHGNLPGRGEFPGMAAAQAIAEPISQGQLCLAAGTLVQMADGTEKKIEEIQVGDEVMGANQACIEKPTKVLRIFDNGPRLCLKTTFTHSQHSSKELVATRDHKVLSIQMKTKVGIESHFYGIWPVALPCEKFYAQTDGPNYLRDTQVGVGILPTYDIEVDNPDHLFMLANGLIVSNSSKHSGGASGEATAVTGFDRINSLVQSPEHIKGGATHSTEDGLIGRITDAPAGGKYVYINGKEHYVNPNLKMTVKTGDRIEAGDLISEGLPSPSTIVQHKGIGEGRRYFVHAMRDAMGAAGIHGHRRNIELLGRGLLDHVRLTDELGDYAPGDLVAYHRLESIYKPRKDAREIEPSGAIGKYLEKPILHYTVGTKVRPSMLKDMQDFGVHKVTVHDKPPPFEPEMVRGMANIAADEDWMTRMYGGGIKGSLLRGAHRGATSDEAGTSFVPSLAKAIDFGHSGLVKEPEPGWTVKSSEHVTTHTRTGPEGTFDMDLLYGLVSDRPVDRVPVKSLKIDRSRKTGFGLVNRYPNVDMSKPILLGESGNVIDGRHRVARHQDEGLLEIPTIRITSDDLAASKIAGDVPTGLPGKADGNVPGSSPGELPSVTGSSGPRDDLGATSPAPAGGTQNPYSSTQPASTQPAATQPAATQPSRATWGSVGQAAATSAVDGGTVLTAGMIPELASSAGPLGTVAGLGASEAVQNFREDPTTRWNNYSAELSRRSEADRTALRNNPTKPWEGLSAPIYAATNPVQSVEHLVGEVPYRVGQFVADGFRQIGDTRLAQKQDQEYDTRMNAALPARFQNQDYNRYVNPQDADNWARNRQEMIPDPNRTWTDAAFGARATTPGYVDVTTGQQKTLKDLSPEERNVLQNQDAKGYLGNYQSPQEQDWVLKHLPAIQSQVKPYDMHALQTQYGAYLKDPTQAPAQTEAAERWAGFNSPSKYSVMTPEERQHYATTWTQTANDPSQPAMIRQKATDLLKNIDTGPGNLTFLPPEQQQVFKAEIQRALNNPSLTPQQRASYNEVAQRFGVTPATPLSAPPTQAPVAGKIALPPAPLATAKVGIS